MTGFLFAFIDMVIDPVALRGDRWFLGKIYYYPEPGVHFGVPFANYIGWAVVGASPSRSIFRWTEGFESRFRTIRVHDRQDSPWLRPLLWSAGL